MDDIDALLNDIENDGFNLEKPKPTNKREAVEYAIKDAGIGFANTFKMDPQDTISKVVENAMPRGIRKEYNVIKEAGQEVRKLYEDNARDLKSGAKKTVDLIKMKTPENTIYRSVLTKLSSALGSDDPDRGYDSNREPTQDEIIARNIESVFDRNRKKDNIEQVIQEVKDNNKFSTTVSILTDVLGNLKYGNQFRDEVTEQYYRKSLELQYKSLYVTKQQLEVTKSGFDVFKTQLEAIVKNVSLPDLVKLRKAEQLKENIQQRFRENITDMFYSQDNPLQNMKNNIVGNIGKFIGGAKMGLSTGNMLMEQSNTLAESGIAPSKAEMIGGELGAKIRDYASDELGRSAEKNDFIRDKMFKAKMKMADPRESLYDLANEQFDKGTRFGKISSKLLKMVGGITEADRANFTRFGEYEPDEATSFDYRTKNSIVKVIPGLLSKIHSEIKSMRTGEPAEDMYFDYNTGKLQNESNVKDNLLKDTAVTFQGAAGANLDDFMSLIERGGGDEFGEDAKINIKGVIIGHLVRNGSISPEALLKDKFLDEIDPEFRDSVKKAISGTIDMAKDDLHILDRFSSTLEGTRNNIPMMDKQIEQYFKNGQIDIIDEMGLVDYDPLRKNYKLNREKYIEVLKESVNYDPTTKREIVPTEEKVNKPSKMSNGIKVPTPSETIETHKPTKITPIVEESERKVVKSNTNLGITKTKIKPPVEEAREKLVEIQEVQDLTATSRKINSMGVSKPKPVMAEEGHIEELVKPVVDDLMKVNAKDKLNAIKKMVVDETKRVSPILKTAIDETKDKLVDLNERMEAPDIKDILSKSKVEAEDMYKKYQDSGAAHTGTNFLSWANTLGYTFVNGIFNKVKSSDVKSDKMKESILGKVKTNLEEMMEIDKTTGKRKFSIKAILKKTREWDRKMFMSIPSVMKKLTVGAFKLPFTLLKGVGSVKDKLFGNKEEPVKAKKPVFGDKDGDGDRDMGWKDRLANAGKKVKDKLTPSKVKAPTKTGGILSSIWGMLKGALPFLGVLAGFGGKMLKGIMGIIPAITGLGGVLKGAVGMLGKGVGAIAGGAMSAGKFIIDKVTGKPKVPGVSKVKVPSKKPAAGKIMNMLKSFKTRILKKLGKKAGAKALAVLTAKIAARAVPFVGLALLAYDATMIAKYMLSDGLSFGSAVSKQILGFDVMSDDDAAVDENGEPIKPDENLKIGEPDENVKSGMDSDIENENKPKDTSFFGSVIDKIKNVVNDKTGVVGGLVDKTSNLFKTGSFKATPGRQEVMGIIDKAAERAGVDPNTLKTFAAVESGFDPNAKAGTSSASGLFQFIKSTWSNMLKKYGPKYDLDPMTSPFDPMANSLMGAEYIKENTKALSGVRDNVGLTDLYMAHFLGPGGAKKLFSTRSDEFAAAILPAAARANKSIFFNKDGAPKTVSEVYNLMQNRLVKKAASYGFNSEASPEEQQKSTTASAKANVSQAAQEAGPKLVGGLNPANNAEYTKKPKSHSEKTTEYSIADGKGGQVKVNEEQFKKLTAYDDKLKNAEIGTDEWDTLEMERESVRGSILKEAKEARESKIDKPNDVNEVSFMGETLKVTPEQMEEITRLRKEGDAKGVVSLLYDVKKNKKEDLIKDSIKNDGKLLTPANNQSNPLIAKTKSKVIDIETAKAKTVASVVTPTKQDLLKPDQMDYRPNFTNLENVLSNSYNIQVGIKQSLEALVELSKGNKIPEGSASVKSPNKAALEVPNAPVGLAKKRYVS